MPPGTERHCQPGSRGSPVRAVTRPDPSREHPPTRADLRPCGSSAVPSASAVGNRIELCRQVGTWLLPAQTPAADVGPFVRLAPGAPIHTEVQQPVGGRQAGCGPAPFSPMAKRPSRRRLVSGWPAEPVRWTLPTLRSVPVSVPSCTGKRRETMGFVETQTRRSEAIPLPDLHPPTGLLIRRFDVRVPGGPPLLRQNSPYAPRRPCVPPACRRAPSSEPRSPRGADVDGHGDRHESKETRRRGRDQEDAELVVHVSSPLERLRLELDGAPLADARPAIPKPVLGAFPLMSQLVHEELRQLFVNFLATTSRLREFLRNKKAL